MGDQQFDSYAVDRSDAPAVDIQQSGGAFQRLTLALVVFAGSLGMIVLLGFLSLAVILAQVVALVLLGFAPVALVIGIFPGGGHDLFRSWLGKLATAVFVKALYSLVIAIVVAVSAALASSTASLGFLFSFALQAVFFWAIFIYRRQISARLVAATTGGHHHDHVPRVTVVQQGARAATRPVSTLLAVPRRVGGQDGSQRQESALAGDTATAASNGAGTATAVVAPVATTGSGAVPTPVSSNGNSSSPAGEPHATGPRSSSSN